MQKSMLDEKNGELQRRRFQIEDELEKRKHIENSEDLTEKDIENFIIESVEQIKTLHEQDDDDLMRIMFNTFVERVDVDNEKITIRIRMDFSILGLMVTNEQLGGVFQSLPTTKIVKVLKRKKQMHNRRTK
jgi:hypothetical protein